MPTLTDKEIKDIERVALDNYSTPYGRPNPETHAFIRAATEERIKSKGLVELLDAAYPIVIAFANTRPGNEVHPDHQKLIDDIQQALINYNKL